MRQQYKVLSCFEQVALQQQNEALQAQVDSLMLEFCPYEMTEEQLEVWGSHQRAAGDNVHDQISDYWEKEETERVCQEDDYVYLFVIVSFTSFLLGFVASYYHYV